MDTPVSRKALINFTKQHAFSSNFAKQLLSELESGAFSKSEGEAERLRDALKYVHGELIGGNIFSQNGLARALTKIESAIDPSTSETAVQQQEQFALSLSRTQLLKLAYSHGGNPSLKEMLCAEADGIRIPGIKDGREGT